MKPFYNQSYSREDIDLVLNSIQDCIRENGFIISKNDNRQENLEFISVYNLNSKRIKEILLRIRTDDFCHTLKNTKTGYEHEILYVFCPRVRLFNIDGLEEEVDIYTKFNIIQNEGGKIVIVISFHKLNRPINYLFR